MNRFVNVHVPASENCSQVITQRYVPLNSLPVCRWLDPMWQLRSLLQLGLRKVILALLTPARLSVSLSVHSALPVSVRTSIVVLLADTAVTTGALESLASAAMLKSAALS